MSSAGNRKPLDQFMGQLPSLRVAAIFAHGYGYVRATADQVKPKNTSSPSPSCDLHLTTTTAIHLELVTDKTSEAFLMAFHRFACLHGHPNICWSDRGSNFVGAQEYLRESMQDWYIPKIQSAISKEFACDFQSQWNTLHASHQNRVV